MNRSNFDIILRLRPDIDCGIGISMEFKLRKKAYTASFDSKTFTKHGRSMSLVGLGISYRNLLSGIN